MIRGDHAHRRKAIANLLLLCVSLLTISACAAQYPVNARIDPTGGAHPDRSDTDDEPSDRLAVVIAFSGGGTRAASLAYGVLEALNREELPAPAAPEGKQRRTFLDHISLISAVSGGSFTAAYYGLHGKGIFKDFRERFLLRDVQGDLTRKFLNPFNWPLLWAPSFGRSDLAQEFYDEILFAGAMLKDLEMKRKPLIMIQGTDVVDGVAFPFDRETFRWICSDFSQFPVSRAVAASSAFPGALSPVVLKNYAGTCNCPTPRWIPEALETTDPANRIYHMAILANLFLDRQKKSYLYLADGGIADNLGIRIILDGVAARGGIRNILGTAKLKALRRIAFIIVDAETQERPAWSLLGQIPGIRDMLGISTDVMVNKYNFETIDLLRRTLREWQEETVRQGVPLDFYLIHLTFSALPEQSERDYFQRIPTTFSLPAEQVDRLREVAPQLLAASADFQRLVHDMRENREF